MEKKLNKYDVKNNIICHHMIHNHKSIKNDKNTENYVNSYLNYYNSMRNDDYNNSLNTHLNAHLNTHVNSHLNINLDNNLNNHFKSHFNNHLNNCSNNCNHCGLNNCNHSYKIIKVVSVDEYLNGEKNLLNNNINKMNTQEKIKTSLNECLPAVSISVEKGNKPKRIKMKMKGGEVVNPYDVYVGRRLTMGGWKLKDSEFKNPFTVKQYGLDECLRLYKEYLNNNKQLLINLKTLEGKRIGCFCELKDKCHIDILIEKGEELGYW